MNDSLDQLRIPLSSGRKIISSVRTSLNELSSKNNKNNQNDKDLEIMKFDSSTTAK